MFSGQRYSLFCIRREQEELIRRQEASVSEEERREVQREQERLLVKLEHKGEQISKLYRHLTQVASKLNADQIIYTHTHTEQQLNSVASFSFLDEEAQKGGLPQADSLTVHKEALC